MSTKLNKIVSDIFHQTIFAASQNTFAVAGTLINNLTLQPEQTLHNNVIKPLKTGNSFTYDPTAHGERQLVFWYYENREKLNLPKPEDMTIITSLDPCVMCTGALLTAGFNVGVIAIDDFAGINYDSSNKFNSLPTNLRKIAKLKFGYYKVTDGPTIYKRTYKGGPKVAFNKDPLFINLLISCSSIFTSTVDQIKNHNNCEGRPKNKLKDPAVLGSNTNIMKAYRSMYPNAFKIKTKHYRNPCKKIYNELIRVKEESSGARNSVGLIDPFGNLILCLPDTFNLSPVHTCFMNLTMKYAQTRWELINNFKSGYNPNDYLTHPKYGTLIFLNAPDYQDPTTIMNLGAYGSTLEGPISDNFPANLQFFEPPVNGSYEKLVRVIQSLPPFYTKGANLSISQASLLVK